MGGSLAKTRATIEQMESIASMIVAWLSFYGPVVVVGSAGRHKLNNERKKDKTFGDIDFLVAPSFGAKRFMDIELSNIFGKNKNGTPKQSVLIGGIQVDVIQCLGENFECARLFYTLPRGLQVALRAIAAARGLKFGPLGLRDRRTNELITTYTEQSVYDRLGIPRFTPQELENAEGYKIT